MDLRISALLLQFKFELNIHTDLRKTKNKDKMKPGGPGSSLSQEHTGPSSVSFSPWNAFFFPFTHLNITHALRSFQVPTVSMKLSLLMSSFLSFYNTYSITCSFAHNGLP